MLSHLCISPPSSLHANTHILSTLSLSTATQLSSLLSLPPFLLFLLFSPSSSSHLPPTAEPYRIGGGSTATVNPLLTVRSQCPYLVRRNVWCCGWIRIHGQFTLLLSSLVYWRNGRLISPEMGCLSWRVLGHTTFCKCLSPCHLLRMTSFVYYVFQDTSTQQYMAVQPMNMIVMNIGQVHQKTRQFIRVPPLVWYNHAIMK